MVVMKLVRCKVLIYESWLINFDLVPKDFIMLYILRAIVAL